MARANAGGEATEKPTPRRLRQARQAGQVAVSLELSRALAVAALLALMAVGIGPALARLVALFRTTLATSLAGELPLATVARAAFDAAFVLSLVPLLTVALTVSIASALQTRGLVAWRAVALDLSRLSPARGWARLFSARTAGDVALGVLKLALMVAIVAASVRPLVPALPRLTAAAPGTVLLVLGAWALRLGLHLMAGLVALGVLDAAVGWWRHQRALMMTRDDVKRDRKEDEGDPRHKTERRRLSGGAPIADQVRRAALVVVRETPSVAIAIHYDRASEATPVIVAKGEGPRAQTIETVARAAGVPVYADGALAHALGDVAEGDALPAALFEPVAEALRIVWGLTGTPNQDRNQA
ncbi:MAG TPA: EscU/YscU/HrcU family type III secretion system export apparatus switch protein [Polyangia bacterium]|nr:EscU/YscU/HrcU family type III secretion system export apparatus switch protein [Polyangia bacterium]